MNIKWNEYTWYSKLAALIFFLAVFPALTFYIGIQYQKTKDAILSTSINLPTTFQHSYKIPELGMALRYPANWSASNFNASSYPTEVTFFEGSNQDNVTKWFEVHFAKGPDASIKQYIINNFPPTEKEYSISEINGNKVLKYDSVLDTTPLAGEQPVNYTRVIDFAIQAKNGQFISINTRAKFPTKEEAQTADMSWADAIVATVNFK